MTQYARPDGTTEDGNWTNNHTNIDNTDDPTGTGADDDVVVGDGTGGSQIQADFTLSNTITDPGVGTGHKLYFRFARGDDSDPEASGGPQSNDCALTVRLMEGSNVRVSRTITQDSTPSISGSFTYNSASSGTTSFNLTAGEANSIGTYNDLFVRVFWEDTEALDFLYLSQVVLETPDVSAATAIPKAMNTYRQMREN